MQLTQRCQYALRALFELARHAEANSGDPVLPSGGIAQSQAIPKRFLDGILLELRQAGFVDSRRGKAGGFFLARPADEITVGQVVSFYNGPMTPVDCREGSTQPCSLKGCCVFQSVWDEARVALEGVYNAISLAELVARERRFFPAERS
jgi:Rrf2 family transcriptional regulator, cysteine metabolism repressor